MYWRTIGAIRLLAPAEFLESEQFEGLYHPALGATIVVERVPAPYREVVAGFTAERLQAEGMRWLSQESVNIDGRAALLVHALQEAHGETYVKWIALFGEAQTFVVTGNVPRGNAASCNTVLRQTLLSACATDDEAAAPKDDVSGYRLTASPPLQLAQVQGRSHIYSESGTLPTRSISEPLFVAQQFTLKLPEDQREAFAKDRIQRLPGVAEIQIERNAPLRVAGLDGREVAGTARHVPSDTAMVVYQAVLFDAAICFIMQGLAGLEQRAAALASFEATARSFERV